MADRISGPRSLNEIGRVQEKARKGEKRQEKARKGQGNCHLSTRFGPDRWS
jgi:hypothetical protein